MRLVRAHLEEDAGKSLHEDFIGQSGIDLNRAGTPLLEIVTEPDMRSSDEAVAYAKELHKIVTWIGICDGNMQEGSFRCDANVSVRKPGAPLGTRREIKNLNSFKFMQQAIDYEIRWQIEEIEDGRAIQQATVLFDPDTGETRAMRTKEDAADYRYFPDPDLPPLVVAPEWVERVRVADAGAAARDGGALRRATTACRSTTPTTLTQSKAHGRLLRGGGQGAAASPSWPATGSWARCRGGSTPARSTSTQAPVGRVHAGRADQPHRRRHHLQQRGAGRCSTRCGRGEGGEVDAVIEAKGLKQMNDTGALEKIIDEVIAANPTTWPSSGPARTRPSTRWWARP